MSSSRGSGVAVTSCAIARSSSVLCPMAETTTQTSKPCSFARTTRSATARTRSTLPTDVPPYFCTMMGRDTAVALVLPVGGSSVAAGAVSHREPPEACKRRQDKNPAGQPGAIRAAERRRVDERTDAQLLLASRTDPQAFTALYRRHAE